MGAAVKAAAGLNTVADDFAAAMFAFWGQRVNGAFETVKVVRDACDDHFDWFIVFISTNFTAVHIVLSSLQRARLRSASRGPNWMRQIRNPRYMPGSDSRFRLSRVARFI